MRLVSSRCRTRRCSRYLVQLAAAAELHRKITQARELPSHVLPSGDLSALFERALDALLKPRFGDIRNDRDAHANCLMLASCSARWFGRFGSAMAGSERS